MLKSPVAAILTALNICLFISVGFCTEIYWVKILNDLTKMKFLVSEKLYIQT
jgi:hypothetical protein